MTMSSGEELTPRDDRRERHYDDDRSDRGRGLRERRDDKENRHRTPRPRDRISRTMNAPQTSKATTPPQ